VTSAKRFYLSGGLSARCTLVRPGRSAARLVVRARTAVTARRVGASTGNPRAPVREVIGWPSLGVAGRRTHDGIVSRRRRFTSVLALVWGARGSFLQEGVWRTRQPQQCQ
jgi:hypothetical protein